MATALAALALAVVSVVLVVVAFRELMAPGDESVSDTMARRGGGLPDGVILFGVCLLLLGGLVGGAAVFGWSRDRALWTGLGTFLALATLARPRWFWEHWKARWLRDLIGDEATALFYLAIAALMVWIGLFTDWTFGRR